MSTAPGDSISFGPYRLDIEHKQLWRGKQVVILQPKPLAVLYYLAQRPGQVVSSKELLKTVWVGTVVTKAVVKECLRPIRGALGEDASAPQYIETVGREGYRFLAAHHATTPLVPGSRFHVPRAATQDSTLRTQHAVLVGQETELARLHAALRKALNGERQVVFVTGEPGIGKTTLVEAFLARVAHEHELRIGYGQCIEQYGGGEAYLPILEAMGRLCREEGGQNITATLRQYAPTWLAQLSGVIPEAEAQALRVQVQGATQPRMLREMAEAIEAGTLRRPLLLVLEDLHWSDQATVELLSYLAQRRERARVMVIGTYRPADLVLGNHPLKAAKQELQAKRQCEELRVELLSQQEVNDYLARRFPHHQFPPALPEEIHQRTEGNALFMVTVVEELFQQGRIVEEQGQWLLTGDITQVNVPDTLRQLIEKQIQQRSDDEQRILEVASVAGTEFAVATVAAALKLDLDTAEETCEDLAWQGHFLEERGLAEWPDGTLSGRYAFRHALYQNVLYEQIAEARRVRLHRSISERLETGYDSKAHEIAAELAVHFEQGRDYQRAVQYLQKAGQRAALRSANFEAIRHLTKGLELLKTLPDTPERIQQELALQIPLAPALMAAKSMAAPEVEHAYARARELCQQVGETPQLVPLLCGSAVFYQTRGKLQDQQEVVEQLLRFAQSGQDQSFLALAHMFRGEGLCFRGELVAALDHLKQGLVLYDSQQYHTHEFLSVFDAGVYCRCFAAMVLWGMGYRNQALQQVREALSLARVRAHSYTLTSVLLWVATIYLLRGELEAAQEQASALVTLATEKGLPDFLAWGATLQGGIQVQQGKSEAGILQIRDGLTYFQSAGVELGIPGLLATLAQAHMGIGKIEEGLSLVAEALAFMDKTGERMGEGGLYILKGWLLFFSQRDPAEVEACFLKAIEITRKRQAKSMELRATMSLARLWQQQGKRTEAQQLLADIYGWFTEGFDTKDL